MYALRSSMEGNVTGKGPFNPSAIHYLYVNCGASLTSRETDKSLFFERQTRIIERLEAVSKEL